MLVYYHYCVSLCVLMHIDFLIFLIFLFFFFFKQKWAYELRIRDWSSDVCSSDLIGANVDEEVGVFVLPPSESGFKGQPILGGGDTAALFNGNDKEAIEVMKFLTSDEFGGPWAKAGGWLSPHQSFDSEQYSSEMTKQIAEIVAKADVFRFDASDLMPKAVGSDSFWDGMVAFAKGESAAKVTKRIDESWPDE